MATSALLPTSSILESFNSITATPPLPRLPRSQERRPAREQGRALELLGHSIEYLIDSRHFEGRISDSENEAIRVLMRCSREVFESCPARPTVSQRVGHWLASHRREHEA